MSHYTSLHPWEECAECCSRYLHVMDALETAFYFAIGLHPEKRTGGNGTVSEIQRHPYSIENFDQLVALWPPLTFAVTVSTAAWGIPIFILSSSCIK